MADTGTLGETITKHDLLMRMESGELTLLGETDGFYKKGVADHGFDFICKDKNGNYIIIESKGTTSGDNVGKSILKTDIDYR